MALFRVSRFSFCSGHMQCLCGATSRKYSTQLKRKKNHRQVKTLQQHNKEKKKRRKQKHKAPKPKPLHERIDFQTADRETLDVLKTLPNQTDGFEFARRVAAILPDGESDSDFLRALRNFKSRPKDLSTYTSMKLMFQADPFLRNRSLFGSETDVQDFLSYVPYTQFEHKIVQSTQYDCGMVRKDNSGDKYFYPLNCPHFSLNTPSTTSSHSHSSNSSSNSTTQKHFSEEDEQISNSPDEADYFNLNDRDTSFKISIQNLPYNIPAEKVYRAFEKTCGNVTGVEIYRGRYISQLKKARKSEVKSRKAKEGRRLGTVRVVLQEIAQGCADFYKDNSNRTPTNTKSIPSEEDLHDGLPEWFWKYQQSFEFPSKKQIKNVSKDDTSQCQSQGQVAPVIPQLFEPKKTRKASGAGGPLERLKSKEPHRSNVYGFVHFDNVSSFEKALSAPLSVFGMAFGPNACRTSKAPTALFLRGLPRKLTSEGAREKLNFYIQKLLDGVQIKNVVETNIADAGTSVVEFRNHYDAMLAYDVIWKRKSVKEVHVHWILPYSLENMKAAALLRNGKPLQEDKPVPEADDGKAREMEEMKVEMEMERDKQFENELLDEETFPNHSDLEDLVNDDYINAIQQPEDGREYLQMWNC